jgi:hypothetical protein
MPLMKINVDAPMMEVIPGTLCGALLLQAG